MTILQLPTESHVVLNRVAIVSLCQSMSERSHCELRTCVSIDNLVGVAITDNTILDFIPADIIEKEPILSGATTISHIYHTSNFNLDLEKHFNEFVTDMKNVKAELAESNSRSDAVTAELAESKSRSNAVTAELAELKIRSNEVTAELAAIRSELVYLSAERGICQIIDNIYKAIFSELRKTGQFEQYSDLSSFLRAKTSDESAKEKSITQALSTISSIPNAGRYWKALRTAETAWNWRRHFELRNQEEAFNLVSDYLKKKPDARGEKSTWKNPPSHESDLKTILLKMIPLIYTTQNDTIGGHQ